MSWEQPLIVLEIDTSMHFMHCNAGKYIKLMIVLIKFGKVVFSWVMESHEILKASDSTNCDKRQY